MIKIIQSYGVQCHQCTDYIQQGTLCLFTKNSWGKSFYYCYRCAENKGESIDPKDDFVSFKRYTSPYTNPRDQFTTTWEDLNRLSVFPIC